MNLESSTKIFLISGGLVLVLIGAGSLFAPPLLAAPLGLAVDSISARNEFRANYGGMHLLVGLLIVCGAWRSSWHVPMLWLAFCFTGGLLLGRLLGLLLDGAPVLSLYLFGALELIAAMFAALLLRCRDCGQAMA